MENLQIGNIAIATVIIGVLDLIIVILVRTETILKAVERIKRVIKLDYKSRAKRSDDEIKLSKKYAQVARERVRNSFVSMVLWNTKWTWNWSDDLQPINIIGFCIGDVGRNFLGNMEEFYCEHPVTFIYYQKSHNLPNSDVPLVGITCSNPSEQPIDAKLTVNIHQKVRHTFEVKHEVYHNKSAEEAFHEIISKAIISQRDKNILQEITTIKKQF